MSVVFGSDKKADRDFRKLVTVVLPACADAWDLNVTQLTALVQSALTLLPQCHALAATVDAAPPAPAVGGVTAGAPAAAKPSITLVGVSPAPPASSSSSGVSIEFRALAPFGVRDLGTKLLAKYAVELGRIGRALHAMSATALHDDTLVPLRQCVDDAYAAVESAGAARAASVGVNVVSVAQRTLFTSPAKLTATGVALTDATTPTALSAAAAAADVEPPVPGVAEATSGAGGEPSAADTLERLEVALHAFTRAYEHVNAFVAKLIATTTGVRAVPTTAAAAETRGIAPAHPPPAAPASGVSEATAKALGGEWQEVLQSIAQLIGGQSPSSFVKELSSRCAGKAPAELADLLF